MSFKWETYLQLADNLINEHKNTDIPEAYLRSAVSRSYYGVFCIAKKFLERKGERIPFRDSHSFVINKFKKSNRRSEKKIGGYLNRLKEIRKYADYDDKVTIRNNDAVLAYLLANSLLDELNSLIV